MNAPEHRPSTAETTATIFMKLGQLGCLVLFLIVFIPVAGVLLYAILGRGEAITVGLILLVIFVGIPVYVRRQSSTWRCGRCRQTFPAGASNCPHCGVTIVPPRSR